jgi:hypothetical protein
MAARRAQNVERSISGPAYGVVAVGRDLDVVALRGQHSRQGGGQACVVFDHEDL